MDIRVVCPAQMFEGSMSFIFSSKFVVFFVVAELSEVLWNMVLHLALGMKGGLGVVAAFALFAFWAGELLFPFPLSFILVTLCLVV